MLAFVLLTLLAGQRPLWAAAAHGMVAAEHELAAQAGVEMFRRGGNAVDAAVAAVFATGVVNPSSCGIGGGGFALVHDARSHRLEVLDFRETAPRGAAAHMYVRDGQVDPRLSLRGALAVAVPGEVRGLTRLLRDFGTLPLATVLEPAIRHAAQGFPVGRHLAEELHRHAEEIRRHADLAAIYLKPDGAPFAEGERLAQADLAATLRAIAEGGEQAFYEGSLAESIARTIAGQHGLLTAEDLRDYRVRLREPLHARYRDATVIAAPPPTGGGVVLEILNVLSGYDLRGAGLSGAFALHRIAQAEAAAFHDRARFYGDPDFTDVPIARLVSQQHAAELRREIAAGGTAGAAATPGQGGTAHTSVMDEHGNAVAVSSTINTGFGSMVVVPGTGIILNNEMDDFSAAPGAANVYGLVGNEANAIGAGKRPLSSMSPVLVLRERAPVLALGGSGGPRIITAAVAALVNVIDFGMPLEAAVAAPRIHHQAVPDRLFFEPTLAPALVAGLRKLGHDLAPARDLGAVQAVQVTARGLVGAADPRKGGVAAGW
ncbi:MAG: gamma-glutamyltransferase [Deltaproteobacteria bacterium]|nr:gamma-glutamyltransferase [Deltaproteobacteria bacterium]